MIDKNELRRTAHDNRNKQEDKDKLSRSIVGKFMSMPEYAAASTVMFYIDVRSEVRTRHILPRVLTKIIPNYATKYRNIDKKVVVPWCNDDGELELFHLESMDELETGMYGILEPSQELRRLPQKQVELKELDLIMVPGVGFDATGARMGHGKGYYDKLLENARQDTPLVALAFECQMFEEIPVAAHDVYMDKIITEKKCYGNIA
jgi:5-formyltetrahydrofolate cyclo-ligase